MGYRTSEVVDVCAFRVSYYSIGIEMDWMVLSVVYSLF